jgi:hypothetical protein
MWWRRWEFDAFLHVLRFYNQGSCEWNL